MNKKDIKIVFIGSANFSVPILEMLIDQYTVELVVTELDKVAGRGKKISSPPTKSIAQRHNIPCSQPAKVKGNQVLIEQIRALEPTVLIVAAYGKLLPIELLEVTPHGCLNVHPSLLPKYRGPSPIQTALLNGDTETGVSIMKLTEAMDAGAILVQEKITIDSAELYESLESRLAVKSTEMLNHVLVGYINNEVKVLNQNEAAATYCYMIDKLDGKLDFNNSAEYIFNQYRAYHGWPGLYCFYGKYKLDMIELQRTDILNVDSYTNGTVFKKNKTVFIKCENSALEVLKIRLESKKETAVKDFLNGHQDFVGTILS